MGVGGGAGGRGVRLAKASGAAAGRRPRAPAACWQARAALAHPAGAHNGVGGVHRGAAVVLDLGLSGDWRGRRGRGRAKNGRVEGVGGKRRERRAWWHAERAGSRSRERAWPHSETHWRAPENSPPSPAGRQHATLAEHPHATQEGPAHWPPPGTARPPGTRPARAAAPAGAPTARPPCSDEPGPGGRRRLGRQAGRYARAAAKAAAPARQQARQQARHSRRGARGAPQRGQVGARGVGEVAGVELGGHEGVGCGGGVEDRGQWGQRWEVGRVARLAGLRGTGCGGCLGHRAAPSALASRRRIRDPAVSEARDPAPSLPRPTALQAHAARGLRAAGDELQGDAAGPLEALARGRGVGRAGERERGVRGRRRWEVGRMGGRAGTDADAGTEGRACSTASPPARHSWEPAPSAAGPASGPTVPTRLWDLARRAAAASGPHPAALGAPQPSRAPPPRPTWRWNLAKRT